jgi:choline dehydrogenase-like flavoprotein
MARHPSRAKAVIIGGGIVGCSTAYHLARLGYGEVLLLERAKLTSGSTFHAAGLVGQLRSNANITQLLKNSVELYDKLEEETGQATGWKMNGGLRLACNQERWTEVKRQATTARSFGLEMDLLTPEEARALWPLMEISDLVGAAFLPTDGRPIPATSPWRWPRARARPPRSSSRTARSPGSRSRTARSWASPRRQAPSLARWWSTAPGSGRARSRRWPGSTCRWSRSSISTS